MLEIAFAVCLALGGDLPREVLSVYRENEWMVYYRNLGPRPSMFAPTFPYPYMNCAVPNSVLNGALAGPTPSFEAFPNFLPDDSVPANPYP